MASTVSRGKAIFFSSDAAIFFILFEYTKAKVHGEYPYKKIIGGLKGMQQKVRWGKKFFLLRMFNNSWRQQLPLLPVWV